MSEATEHREPFLGAFLLRLGIAVIVTGGLITAIFAWNQASASSTSNNRLEGADGRASETRLALADSDELADAALTDVQVVESAKAAATTPKPHAEETSTTEASIDLDPPKLAAAVHGSDMALSPVEPESEDLGSAIEPGEREQPAEESEGFRLPVGIGVSVGGFSGGTVTIGGGAGGISIGGSGLGSFGRRGVGIITSGGRGCQGAAPVPVSGPIADGSGPLSEGPVPVPGGSSTGRLNPTLPSVPNTLGLPVEPNTFAPGSDRGVRREAGAEGRFRPSDQGRSGRNLVTEATSGFGISGQQAGAEATQQAASTRQQARSMRQRVQQALRPQAQRVQRASKPQARRVQAARPQAQRVQRASKPQARRVQQAARPAANRRENRATSRPAVQRTQRVQASRSRPASRSVSQARGVASRSSEN